MSFGPPNPRFEKGMNKRRKSSGRLGSPGSFRVKTANKKSTSSSKHESSPKVERKKKTTLIKRRRTKAKKNFPPKLQKSQSVQSFLKRGGRKRRNSMSSPSISPPRMTYSSIKAPSKFQILRSRSKKDKSDMKNIFATPKKKKKRKKKKNHKIRTPHPDYEFPPKSSEVKDDSSVTNSRRRKIVERRKRLEWKQSKDDLFLPSPTPMSPPMTPLSPVSFDHYEKIADMKDEEENLRDLLGQMSNKLNSSDLEISSLERENKQLKDDFNSIVERNTKLRKLLLREVKKKSLNSPQTLKHQCERLRFQLDVLRGDYEDSLSEFEGFSESIKSKITSYIIDNFKGVRKTFNPSTKKKRRSRKRRKKKSKRVRGRSSSISVKSKNEEEEDDDDESPPAVSSTSTSPEKRRFSEVKIEEEEEDNSISSPLYNNILQRNRKIFSPDGDEYFGDRKKSLHSTNQNKKSLHEIMNYMNRTRIEGYLHIQMLNFLPCFYLHIYLVVDSDSGTLQIFGSEEKVKLKCSMLLKNVILKRDNDDYYRKKKKKKKKKMKKNEDEEDNSSVSPLFMFGGGEKMDGSGGAFHKFCVCDSTQKWRWNRCWKFICENKTEREMWIRIIMMGILKNSLKMRERMMMMMND